MILEPLDIGRYMISIDGRNSYLIEVDAYSGNGWCGCQSFQCVHQPVLERDSARGLLAINRCKHLIAYHNELKSNPTPTDGSHNTKEAESPYKPEV